MQNNVRRYLLTCALFAFGLLLFPIIISAQNRKNTEYKADQTERSNARVNPSTLAMELSIPLASYPGRAGNSLPVTFDYSSKVWRIAANPTNWRRISGTVVTDTRPDYAEKSAAGWTTSLDVPRIDTTLDLYVDDDNGQGRPWANTIDVYNNDPNPPVYPLFYIKRVRVEMPDGSAVEFRKDDGVHPYGNTQNPGVEGGHDLRGTFLAVDGSRMRLEMGAEFGVLFMPDGGRYELPIKCLPRCTQNTVYMDRHGNRMSYNPDNKQWTDTLGRTLVNALPIEGISNPQQAAGVRTISYPGVNGSPLQYEFTWSELDTQHYTSNISCNGNVAPVRNPYLFITDSNTRVCGTTVPFKPVVLTKIKLPDGTSYNFSYNIFGEIVKIEYPTGGYEQFEYGYIQPVASTGDFTYDQANRGVLKRWVSEDGRRPVTEIIPWRYEVKRELRTWLGESGVHFVNTIAPNGTLSEQFIHDEWKDEAYPYGFGEGRIGRAYETRVYADEARNQLLRRTLTEWTNTGPVTVNGAAGYSGATRDLRASRSIEISFEAGSNPLAKLSTTEYDLAGSGDLEQFAALNPKQSKTYKYRTLDLGTAQTASLATIAGLFTAGDVASISQTDYLYDGNYKARGIVGLAAEQRVIDPATNAVVSRAQTAYDEPSYGLLFCSPTVGWIYLGTAYRGNATTSRSWLNTSNTWIETHTQYDQCGNVRKSWDAKGNVSEVEYSAGYQFAYPTRTISAVPDPSGERGSATPLETSTTYDYTTGKVIQSRDANNSITRFQYNDSLNRLSKVELADGGYTEFWYDRNQHGDYTGSRSLINDTGQKTESYQFFDGLGRSSRSFQLVGVVAGEGSKWQTSDTEYDNMGRVWRVSNPYISGGAGGAVTTAGWTTTEYDALGRAHTVTAPDGAKAKTVYSNKTAAPLGTQVTVSHQAEILRSRTGIADALGRLVQVVEDPGGLNYITENRYDVLGNLRMVDQGGQKRYFAYDSLSRLIRVKQPEEDVNGNLPALTDAVTNNNQWSQAFAYDNNGNLVTRTDARNVTTNFIYDSLNRVRDFGYTDGITPGVGFGYDNSTNGKGRLNANWTYLNSPISLTTFSYEVMGRVNFQQQHFWVNGAWVSYLTSRIYDRLGNVTSQTYPSGHVVKYDQFDDAGRLKNFTGNLGDGVQRSYAANITYDEASRLSREQFGTQTPLYHKKRYNVRGQMWDTRLSTKNDTDDWNRGMLVNLYSRNDFTTWGVSGADNNGNVLRSHHYVPGDDQINTASVTLQDYTYDKLNRLESVTETSGQNTGGGWGGWAFAYKQAFNYDQWGNRTINQANTTVGINKTAFDVNTANNRLYAPGQRDVADASRTLRYDKAGNITMDVYSANDSSRVYDAENRMTEVTGRAKAGGLPPVSRYVYDANGKRVRRIFKAEETWQVYGIDGELLAEYAANTAANNPQKEYGYRNGELLVIGESASSARASGGTTAASNAVSDAATFVSQSVPNVMQTGQRYDVAVRMRNTGTSSWTSANYGYNLGSESPRDNTTWGTHRVKLPAGTTVAPGEEYTFSFTVTAPSAAGSYGFQWRMVHDGVAWFGGDPTPNVVVNVTNAALHDGATFVSQSVPSRMQPGQRYDVAVRIRNTGTSSWTSANYGYNLGSESPRDNTTWGTHRVKLPPSTTAVAPGEEVTFSFTVTAPSAAGNYGFQWWMVHDGVAWFGGGPTPNVVVNVTNEALQNGATFVSQSVPSVMQAGRPYNVSVRMRNTGTSSWTATNLFRLGSENPRDNQKWGMHRVEMPAGTTVAPGTEYTFNFTVTAPSAPGSYGFQWQMVHDGVGGGWFGNTTPNIVVAVNAGGGGGTAGSVKWLVTDHLGTPRMIADQTGSLAGITRHDYLPFGEELFTSGRTVARGYTGDTVRQKFTAYERDTETGLDYAQARYYSSAMGRFTSVDPLLASGNPINPKTLNRYAYVLNNPLRYTDPSGLIAGDYYNLDGKKIGTDGVADEKIYIVYNKDKAQEIEKSTGNYTGTVDAKITIANADVITAIGDAVTRSNAPTSDDKDGGSHEEGVTWKTTNGKTEITAAPAGAYADVTKDGGASIRLPTDVDGNAHVHPKAQKSVGNDQIASFVQPPSDADVTSARGTSIVVGARDEKVYFYQASGNTSGCSCIAKMSLKNFLKIGK